MGATRRVPVSRPWTDSAVSESCPRLSECVRQCSKGVRGGQTVHKFCPSAGFIQEEVLVILARDKVHWWKGASGGEMSSRNGSDGGAPTRWRSTHGLAEPGSEEQTPMPVWKSTGNLYGAGSLPRPWSRQRTGNNVQKLLERLQSQEEDTPRPSWADQVDEHQTSDAPRTKLRSGLPVSAAGTEAKRLPRPRPRSMGELLGLTPKDQEAEEKELERSAGLESGKIAQGSSARADGVTKQEKHMIQPPVAARRNVPNAAQTFDDLDSRSRTTGFGSYQSRDEDSPVRRPLVRTRDQLSDGSHANARRVDVSDSPRIRGEPRHEESWPNAATRARPHRARHGVEDTEEHDVSKRHRNADRHELHTEALPSTARYREESDAKETPPTRRVSAAEASAIRDIKKAAKTASGGASGDELAEPEGTSAADAPKERRWSRHKDSVEEESVNSAPLKTNNTSPPRIAARFESDRSPPLSDLISQEDDHSLTSRRARLRRALGKPVHESDVKEPSRERSAGKVEVKVLAAELKSGGTEVLAPEAEMDGLHNLERLNTSDRAVKNTRSKTSDHDGNTPPETKTTNNNLFGRQEGELAGHHNGKKHRNRKVAEDGLVKAAVVEIIAEGTDAKPVEEPKYKPVAAPRRLTASGMAFSEVPGPQPASRVIDLNSSKDYKRIRPRGAGKLANTKEGRIKVVPVGIRSRACQ